MSNTILLIEDNANMADNIASILELAHYKVLLASNGKVGAAMAQQHHPDLILCDIAMPELDGFGVFHILNSDPDTADIPFVFLTARSDVKDVRTGMNMGADDYITKPFDELDLLKVIDVRLKKKARGGKESESSNASFSKTKELREFHKLSENRPVRTFRKKDFLFMEGQSPNDLFFINKGSVKTYKINYDGKELITRMYHAGEFLGYVPLLEEKPYSENAEALEETEVAIIPKDDFLSLIYSSKDVARKFLMLLSVSLDENEKRLLDLAYQSVRQRVAGTLLQIASKNVESGGDLTITMARRDIANLIGTAIESLNRTLIDFKEEGLIQMTDAGLKILDRHKLESLLR